MPIEFACPQCKEMLQTPDGTAGQMTQCPLCHSAVQIPAGRPPVGGYPTQPAMTAPAYDPTNPYQAPPDVDTMGWQPSSPDLRDAELIRRENLNHEASVRSVGWLFYLGAVLLVFGLIAMISLIDRVPLPMEFLLIMIAIYGVMAVASAFSGYGLRRLRPWARILTGILASLSVLGLLINIVQAVNPDFRGPRAAGNPIFILIGLLLNIYILYLLFSPKGSTVFSAEYKQIIDQTPHIRYRTSIIVWIVLGLLIFVILLGVVGLLLG
ncbi:MAG: hypothetical protein JW818_14075 [Pirellulales bacterium]|nr:hypothetical protein [Pirellulales bacterium]